MSELNGRTRAPLPEIRDRVIPNLIPLDGKFSYYRAGQALTDEDKRDYLEDPVAALPVPVMNRLPKVMVLLAPHLERNGKSDLLTTEPPPENKLTRSAMLLDARGAFVVYGIDDMEVAAYHYELYRHLATLVADRLTPDESDQYGALLREELKARMHGEVDDASWQKKQELLRRSSGPKVRASSKAFREYARESFIDTMTLYLHGICCDIDVEPGPRQLPSPKLRRRLKLLQTLFPQPKGYAVFPEEIDQVEAAAEVKPDR